MFKFLKNKLKETVEKFTKKAEEESEEVVEDTLSEEDLSILKSEKNEADLIDDSISTSNSENVFKSVDDLIPDTKNNNLSEDVLSKNNLSKKSLSEDDSSVDESIDEKQIDKPVKESSQEDSIKELNEKNVENDSVEDSKNDLKEISKKDLPVDLAKELSNTSTVDGEDSNKLSDIQLGKDDISEEKEVDPLVAEVIEKNKSFEEAEQQIAISSDDNCSPEVADDVDVSGDVADVKVADDVDVSGDVADDVDRSELLSVDNDLSESKSDEVVSDGLDKSDLIDEEILKSEIVEDDVEDSSVVEDILALDDDVKLVDSKSNSQSSEGKKGFFKRIFSKKESEVSADEVLSEHYERVNSDVDVETISEETISSSSTPDAIVSHNDSLSISELDESSADGHSDDDLLSSKDSEENSNSEKVAVRADLLSDDIGDATKKKKGFFGKLKDRVVKFQLTDEVFEDLFWDFELALLEGNVASEVIEKIKSDLKEKLTSENISRKEISDVIFETLKNSLDEILSVPTFDLLERIKNHQLAVKNGDSDRSPFVICVVGVNGSGKTTTLAKLINLFQKNDLSLVVAAADTFRAAAIQQLEEHTTKLDVKLIKHDYNADPAAVAFDAVKHAQSKNLDVVLIDTAGRLQSNSNLMDELKKLVRVNKPDLTIFIGESITGNDCVEQAVAFNDLIGVDGIILSKADVDDKGGAAISVSYVTKKPILYLGTGQNYGDLKPFNKEDLLQTLGL